MNTDTKKKTNIKTLQSGIEKQENINREQSLVNDEEIEKMRKKYQNELVQLDSTISFLESYQVENKDLF